MKLRLISGVDEKHKVVERTNQHQAAVKKRSGSEVRQGMFLDGSCNPAERAYETRRPSG